MTFRPAPNPDQPFDETRLRELIESEARYRAIVESQAELISLACADGTLEYVNAAYGRHFGREPASLIGSNLLDLVPAEEREAVRQLIAGVLQTGQMGHGENRLLAPDGARRWMAWTNSIYLDGQGRTLLHSVGRDITERRLAEHALRDSQSLLDRTGRVAGVGGWELDTRSGTVTWSDETRRIHEVEPDFVPTLENAVAFYTPEARTLVEAAVARGIAKAQPWDLELPFVTAKGRPIWVRAVGEAEFENGKVVRLVGAFQDITERRALQDRLAASERFVHQVTDNLPVRIAYIDRDKRYRFVNRAHCLRFGLAREQIIGHTRGELTGEPADRAGDQRADGALAGQAQRFEFDESGASGLRRIESQFIPDRSPDGSVAGFFAIGIDITERSETERALRELSAIIESSADYVVQTDWRGEISYLNPAARRAMGLPAQGPLPEGSNFSHYNTAETNTLFAQTILPAVRAQGSWIGNTTVLAAGERVVPVSQLVIAHPDDSGRVARYSAVMRDISAAVVAQQALQRQAATLRSVAEAIPALVAVVGTDQRYRFVNSAFERWVGSPRDRILGRTVREVIGSTDQARSQPWIDRVLAGESVNFERDYQVQGQARHYAVSYVPLWSDSGAVDGFVGVLHDISEHRQESVRLMHMSQADALTGLLNRAGFEKSLEAQLKSGQGASLALLFIDLDHFKAVNDEHGHRVGDEVLKAFAQRLRHLVRPNDVVARLGGDEFVVLLGAVRERAHAEVVATKVVAAGAAPFELAGLHLKIGASVGVAHGMAEGSTVPDLLARADALLYRAKKSGRGRHAGEGDSTPST